MRKMKKHSMTVAACTMAAVLSVSTVTVMAAEAGQAAGLAEKAQSAATVQDLLQKDIVDTKRTASLTIHKYDITAAEAAGEYTRGEIKASGQADSRVEQKMKDFALEGVQFTYATVGEIETFSYSAAEKTDIHLVYEIPDDLRKILTLKTQDAADMQQEGLAHTCSRAGVYHYTSTQLSEALQGILEADETGTKRALEAYLYKDTSNRGEKILRDGAAHMKKTDAAGLTSVDGLPLGLYLLVETEIPEMVTDTVSPWFVSLPFTNTAADQDNGVHNSDGVSDAARVAGTEAGMSGGEYWVYDMVCYPKNQTGNPTLDKSVKKTEDPRTAYGDTATASAGDTLSYIVVSKLPHISSPATGLTEYTFTDVLGQGMEYLKDTKIALYKSAQDADENRIEKAEEIWDLQSGNFRAEYQMQPSGSSAKDTEKHTRMTVRMTQAGLDRLNGNKAGTDQKASGGFSDYYMVVQYSAAVHTDASVTLGDEGNVNDVNLLWRRTSSQYSNALQDRNYVYSYGLDLLKTFTGASEKKADPEHVQFKLYNVTDGYYVLAEQHPENGLYYVTGKTGEKKAATTFVPAANGKLYVYGLEADTYQLTEVATEDGYTLLQEPVEVKIQATDREVIAAVAGTTGLDKAAAEAIVKQYGGGIRNEDGQLVTEAESAFAGDTKPAGPKEETANGRSIGKTDMYVGKIQNASATVNGQAVTMENGSPKTADQNSANAIVPLQVTNHKGFLLPQTGGGGLYLITILGVGMAGIGCIGLNIKGRKKESEAE